MSQRRLFRFVTDLLPTRRKSRRKVLALGVQGLLGKRRLTLTALARAMESTRGGLSFLSLALEWLDALPATRYALRRRDESG